MRAKGAVAQENILTRRYKWLSLLAVRQAHLGCEERAGPSAQTGAPLAAL